MKKIIILTTIILLIGIIGMPMETKAINGIIIDLQIGNPKATINLPSNLRAPKPKTEERILDEVNLIVPPFITKDGIPVMAIRDLENILSAKIEWCSVDKTVRVNIPAGTGISKKDIKFIVKVGDRKVVSNSTELLELSPFILNGRCFVSIWDVVKLLGASEVIWITETLGVRLIFQS